MPIPLDNLARWKADALKTLRRTIDRRSFLRRGLAAFGGAAMAGTLLRMFSGTDVLAAEPAGAEHAVKTGTFFFPRLKFNPSEGPAIWDTYPIADVNLRRQIRKLTNINVSEEPVVVSLADLDQLCRYPFVFATDEKHFRFVKQEEDNLREFLLRGGFVYGDDCVLGSDGDLFFQDYRNMMNKIWPENPMRRVPDDHDLYHCFFDLPGLPFLQGKNHGSWATFDRHSGRILTLVTPTDMHCGWTGMFFTPDKNLQSLKMGVNIVVYYLSH